MFRAYAQASRHVYINLHPASSSAGCWNVRKQYTVAQPFRTSFCPRTKTNFEVYRGLYWGSWKERVFSTFFATPSIGTRVLVLGIWTEPYPKSTPVLHSPKDPGECLGICSAECSCGSVVEHCVSSTKGCGFNSQGTHILIIKKMYSLNAL